ncbi:MAG: acetyltransferase [Flavobacteriales bacterium]
MKKLAIIGSGDLGQQIAWHAKQTGRFEVVGFFDDFAQRGEIKHEVSVIGPTTEIGHAFEKGAFDEIIIAIGYHHFETRSRLFEEWKDRVPFATIIHPNAYVDSSANIGKGCVIYPGCTVDMLATLRENVLLNVGCVIAHDSLVGKHSFLSPAVKVAGFVTIGECVSLGIGTTIIDNLSLCSNTRTGAGAVVIDHIEIPGLYVGVPATFKKPNA